MRLGKTFLIILFSLRTYYSLMTLTLKRRKTFDEFKVNKRMKFNIPGEWRLLINSQIMLGGALK